MNSFLSLSEILQEPKTFLWLATAGNAVHAGIYQQATSKPELLKEAYGDSVEKAIAELDHNYALAANAKETMLDRWLYRRNIVRAQRRESVFALQLLVRDIEERYVPVIEMQGDSLQEAYRGLTELNLDILTMSALQIQVYTNSARKGTDPWNRPLLALDASSVFASYAIE
jgi:hypothetical protein